MFFTCGPNEAMVVSGEWGTNPPNSSGRRDRRFPGLTPRLRVPPPAGFCRSPPVMVAGGRVLVVPCLQQIQR